MRYYHTRLGKRKIGVARRVSGRRSFHKWLTRMQRINKRFKRGRR